MANFIQTISIALLALAVLCNASSARLGDVRTSKSKKLDRQEVADDTAVQTQTPYPPAGIRPGVPFNLPTDEKLTAPVNYYLPPNAAPAKFNSVPTQVYGPPEVSAKDDVEEILVKDKPAQESQPEKQESEEEDPNKSKEAEFPLSAAEETEQETSAPETETVPVDEKINDLPRERIVLAKNKLSSAKLQLRPATSLKQRPIYVLDGPLYAFNGRLFRF